MSPTESLCREGSREEWTGFFVLTQIQKDQQSKGDEYHVAKAIGWIGEILADCFPALFPDGTTPVGAPPEAEPAAPSPPPTDAKPTAE